MESIEQAAPLLPFSQLFAPHPFSSPAALAARSGPRSSAVGGRGRRAGAAAQAQRVGGAEARRRSGAAGCTRKVAHGCKKQETSIEVSGGRPLPSHGCVEASAAERPDSGAGSQRPRRSQSSPPPVFLRKAPSLHPSPAPLRVATRADEDSASTPVGGGGPLAAPVAEAVAEGRHRPVHPTQPAPLLRHDEGASLSTTARSRGWRRSPFVSAPCSGGGLQQSQRRRRWRGGDSRPAPSHLRRVAAPSPRVLWRPMEHFCCPPPLPAPPLPPHSGCAECDATLARPARPPLPLQSDTPCPTHGETTNTLKFIDETHVRIC